MSSYFDENNKWTPEALAVTAEMTTLLRPVFEREILKGYSYRELAHLAFGAAFELELMKSMDASIPKNKAPQSVTMRDRVKEYWAKEEAIQEQYKAQRRELRSEWARTIQETQKPEEAKDVHTEHCCAAHGCKYGDRTCPVATFQKTQSFPCEDCTGWNER